MLEISNDEIEKFHLQVGSNVKRIREEKGLSQMELSLAIGHNSSALVAKAEIGTYNKHFNLSHLYKISKALDVSICDLLPLDT